MTDNKLHDKEFLYTEYITNNNSCQKIALKLNSSASTVHKFLKEFKITEIKQKNNIDKWNSYLNKKCGKLMPLSFSGPPCESKDVNNKYKHWVECKCDCGNITKIPLALLIGNIAKSCGCLKHNKGKNNPNYKGYEEISGKFFTHIKRTAMGGTNKRKRICKEFTLTIEFLWNLYIKQNKKCALSGLLLTFATDRGLKNGNCSLDRIDSSKGYIENNVQWVHKMVNMMKNKYNQTDFVKMCELVSNNFNDVNRLI